MASPFAEDAERWRRRVAGTTGLEVGLAWAGRADGRDDHLRSPGLAAFAPALAVPSVAFFGLQLGDGRSDLERYGGAERLVDLGPELTDMAETAAAMSAIAAALAERTRETIGPPRIAP
ncbi:MAG: hypothetical protein EXQ95_12610 [Alphaproteobacteria bacterium]|nr:hypothetical protein [Alphaproteobacteria bacterium]